MPSPQPTLRGHLSLLRAGAADRLRSIKVPRIRPIPVRSTVAGAPAKVNSAAQRALPTLGSGVMIVLRSPWFLGPIAGLLAVLVGALGAAVLVIGAAATSMYETTSWPEWFTAAGVFWVVVTNFIPVGIGEVTYSLLPWGFALANAAVLFGVGSWLGRTARMRTVVHLLIGAVLAVGVYAASIAAVAQLVSSPMSDISARRAAATALVVAAICIGVGARRSSGINLHIADHIPGWLRVVVRAGLIAALATFGVGAVLFTVWLVMNFTNVSALTTAINAGVVGNAALFLLTLGYLPTLVMWAVSYGLGAGFSVGSATVLSPFLPSAVPSQLPAIPVFAGLPEQAHAFAWLYPLGGVLAGALAGWYISRAARREPLLMRVVIILGATTTGALVLAAAGWLSSGALGAGNLAFLGVSPQLVASLAWITFTVGALPIGMALGHERVKGSRSRHLAAVPAEPDIPADILRDEAEVLAAITVDEITTDEDVETEWTAAPVTR